MAKSAAAVIVPLGFLFFISGLVINLFQVLLFGFFLGGLGVVCRCSLIDIMEV